MIDAVLHGDAADLFAMTAALVGIPSVHPGEGPLADAIEARVRGHANRLRVDRVGNSVVVRSDLGCDRRVVLGGHLDTVPPRDNFRPRVEGDVLHGVGAADMKGGVAVMLALVERAVDGRFDTTFVFYDGEEVEDEHNGLRHVVEQRPELVDGDFAVLLEPTGGAVEAGCQGTLHMRATFEGARAHTARPWTGTNAIHRAAPVADRIAAHRVQPVEVDGLVFPQAVQLVRVDGGVANNVVPDRCSLVVNRRFAPTLSVAEAEGELRELLDGADHIEVLNASAGALPNLADPLVAEFAAAVGGEVHPKLGWTDVARFAALGVPAVNFGPGDASVAHSAAEAVTRPSLDAAFAALAAFLGIS
ncbi:MAG: succinyl-diaminopimelate desuccinylase [Acidimicrobiia bacterium]